MHASGSTNPSPLKAIDRMRWEIRIKDFLRRNGEGLSFIKCHVADSCVICIPLRDGSTKNVAAAAKHLREVASSNEIVRWEVMTLFPA